MATVTLTLEEYEAMRNMIMNQAPADAEPEPVDPPKKKRKVSRYQKEFGRQMKRLKALHSHQGYCINESWTFCNQESAGYEAEAI